MANMETLDLVVIGAGMSLPLPNASRLVAHPQTP